MNIKHLFLAGLLMFPAIEASAATYTYVGSWDLSDPNGYSTDLVWTANPEVYTGQEAAAYLFGGDASDYAISTVSDQVADINYSAWVDGWGDPYTYGPSGTGPAAEDFSLDSTGLGYNGCTIAGTDCYQSAYSALVYDHFPFEGGPVINYAFRISEVPLPAGGVLLVSGIAGLGALKRRRKAA